MSIEVNSSNIVCSKCGTSYGRRKGYFSVNYGALYKGVGYLTVCKKCVDSMYNTYLHQLGSAEEAVKQMCRKLDLYWNERVFESVEKKNTAQTMMTAYIAKINTSNYVGKSYDDTISETKYIPTEGVDYDPDIKDKDIYDDEDDEDIEISDEVKNFWGAGYTSKMYKQLEQRRSYWMSKYPEGTELDIGAEAIIRQICSLELDINRDRANGKSVEKSVNALNNLLGSASLKPTQRNKDTFDSNIDRTPLGVWAQRYEQQRPIKEIDPELQDQQDHKYQVSFHLLRVL